MYHIGGGHHHAFDEDEILGKVYDSQVIRRLSKYLAPFKSWLSLGVGGMVLRSLATLAAPYIVAVATDRFIQTGNLLYSYLQAPHVSTRCPNTLWAAYCGRFWVI